MKCTTEGVNLGVLNGRSCWYAPTWDDQPTSPGWPEERRQFSCQDPDEPNEAGQGTSRGCDAGCENCPDYPVEFIKNHFVPLGGPRFLAPARHSPNRAADGLIRDIRSEPMRIPRRANFRRAACWENGLENNGIEHFGQCQCDCWPGNVISPVGACTGGVGVGEPVLGAYHDCYAYTSFNIKPGIECRGTDEHYDRPVQFAEGRLFNVANHRTNGCMPNLMLPCAGAAPNSQCTGSFDGMGQTGGWYYSGPWDDVIIYFDAYCKDKACYYSDQDDSTGGHDYRQRFNYLNVAYHDIRLRNDRNDPVIDAKNAVLRWIAERTDWPNFRQFDFQGNSGNPNSVDYWQRSLIPTPGKHQVDMPAVGYDYPNSYVRQIGSRADGVQWPGSKLSGATLRVKRASIEMSLYVIQGLRGHGLQNRELTPYATVRIRAECVVTVDQPQIGILYRPWLNDLPVVLRIVNNESGHSPIVYSDPLEPPIVTDEIVFVDDQGRASDPPVIVEWWGMLGHFSNPQTANLYATHRPTDAEFAHLFWICENFRTGLQTNGLRIGGWPYESTNVIDPNQLYLGELELRFPA